MQILLIWVISICIKLKCVSVWYTVEALHGNEASYDLTSRTHRDDTMYADDDSGHVWHLVQLYKSAWAIKGHGPIQKFPLWDPDTFFRHQHHRGPYEPPSRSKWTQWSQIVSRGWSVPVLLRKPIATCVGFPGWGSLPLPPSSESSPEGDQFSDMW